MVTTFTPFGSDFKSNAECLDRARLTKQRLEAKMILATLSGKSRSWWAHPVMDAWRGHLNWLYDYNIAIYDEFARRGYNDHTRPEFEQLFEDIADDPAFCSAKPPYWLDSSNNIYTQRGNLHRKKPEHYTDFAIYADYREYVCCPDRTCNNLWSAHLEKRIKEDHYIDDIFKIAPNEMEKSC